MEGIPTTEVQALRSNSIYSEIRKMMCVNW